MAQKYFVQDEIMKTEGSRADDEFQIKNLTAVINCQIEMHRDIEVAANNFVQDTGHYIYITPQLFENFIRTYKGLLKYREVKLHQHLIRFKKGHKGILKCL